MFAIGDKVVSSCGLVGHVTFVEDDYIEIDPGNGNSIEFNVSSLTMWTAPEPVKPPQHDLQGTFNAPYIPRKGDRRLATEVIRIVNSVAPIFLDAAAFKNEGFHQLDDFDKVKIIAKMSGTPMVVFMGAGEMGDRKMMQAVIQKTLLNNILNMTDFVSDLLLGKAKQVVEEYETPCMECGLLAYECKCSTPQWAGE